MHENPKPVLTPSFVKTCEVSRSNGVSKTKKQNSSGENDILQQQAISLFRETLPAGENSPHGERTREQANERSKLIR